jgi:hypothetical protein
MSKRVMHCEDSKVDTVLPLMVFVTGSVLDGEALAAIIM